ncbi:NtrZ family periplasmic regulatory protein [Hyphobacterium marinum]|uniref:Outer membrane protein beta-barrel domain-containing protein n=1 Tax=Hyphobacterium marinum TaxID=3116574 RepID=A0ABU7LUW9_9PROT|nr:hypothetical protein [Hyphobacterium sp. Y6023]MEE2565356.1 hypothetical protein [Hyphobacterium sp. Y6023]
MDKITKFKGLATVLSAAALLAAAPCAFADPDLTAGDDAQPWYEAFTFSTDATIAPGVTLNDTETQIDWNAGERWGFTLGIDSDPDSQLNLDTIETGVYFDVGSRFRFRGAVRLTAPDALYVGTHDDERAPEVKFESALRF